MGLVGKADLGVLTGGVLHGAVEAEAELDDVVGQAPLQDDLRLPHHEGVIWQIGQLGDVEPQRRAGHRLAGQDVPRSQFLCTQGDGRVRQFTDLSFHQFRLACATGSDRAAVR